MIPLSNRRKRTKNSWSFCFYNNFIRVFILFFLCQKLFIHKIWNCYLIYVYMNLQGLSKHFQEDFLRFLSIVSLDSFTINRDFWGNLSKLLHDQSYQSLCMRMWSKLLLNRSYQSGLRGITWMMTWNGGRLEGILRLIFL